MPALPCPSLWTWVTWHGRILYHAKTPVFIPEGHCGCWARWLLPALMEYLNGPLLSFLAICADFLKFFGIFTSALRCIQQGNGRTRLGGGGGGGRLFLPVWLRQGCHSVSSALMSARGDHPAGLR